MQLWRHLISYLIPYSLILSFFPVVQVAVAIYGCASGKPYLIHRCKLTGWGKEDKPFPLQVLAPTLRKRLAQPTQFSHVQKKLQIHTNRPPFPTTIANFPNPAAAAKFPALRTPLPIRSSCDHDNVKSSQKNETPPICLTNPSGTRAPATTARALAAGMSFLYYIPCLYLISLGGRRQYPPGRRSVEAEVYWDIKHTKLTNYV